MVVLHVLSNFVCNVTIKPAEQDGAHHDCYVKAQPGQEAGTFERDVASSYNQGLAW